MGWGILVVLTALADTLTRGKLKSKIKYVPVIWHWQIRRRTMGLVVSG